MQYRITIKRTEVIVIEGEGDLAYAEMRADELSSGMITEDGKKEVSSYRSFRPKPTLEMLMDEEQDLWVEVVPEAEVVG